MAKGIICIIYLSVLLMGISCRNQSERVELIHQKAEDLLALNPDSALVILSEINHAEKLSKKLYYQYYLVQIQAKYKAYKDITTDTLIFTIRDYYTQKNDIENTALATFYCGRVYEEQKNHEKALQEYLLAESNLEKSQDFNLKGLSQSAIGQIYYNQLLKLEAISYYKQAKDYFIQAKNYKNEIIVTTQIGNCFLIAEKQDSAFFYYHQAYSLADRYEYKNQKASIRVSLGVAHKQIEDWEQSEAYFKEALTLSDDSLDRARLFSNLTKLMQEQGKADSAKYYLQQSLLYLPKGQYNFLAANIYKTWSAIEESERNYNEALEKYKQYSTYLARILSENKNAAILDIEAKYNFQLIENQNKQLLIERQRNQTIALLLVFSLGVFFFFLWRRSLQNKKQLMETEQKVRQLKRLANEFDEKEESFRTILMQHFDVIKKAALLEGYLKEDERKKGEPLLRKFNEVVYGQKELDWEVLYQKLNELSNMFFESFKQQFPQLDTSEFRICCLLYVDFNNTEIAIILNYSTNTVQAKKSLVRKKLGIKSFGNIHDFMKESIEN